MTHKIARGDVLETLRLIPDNTFHAAFTDPPYGLSFMGKKWDYDVPSPEVWRELFRVLRPGATLLSFGGSRTYHRIAVGIEDAGFELRDCLHWLYGKGFPKSHDVSKALDKASGTVRPVVGERTLTGNAAVSLKDKGGTFGVQVGTVPPKVVPVTGPGSDESALWEGYGTALKPAYEPIALARKPLDGTMVDNLRRWGCGPLAIDACRIGDGGGTAKANCPKGDSSGVYGDGINGACDVVNLAKGRWPANLILDEVAGELLDAQAGDRPSRISVTENGGGGKIFGAAKGHGAKPNGGYSDSGGPSRFFYSAKVSTREREAGTEHLPRKSAGEMTDREEETPGLESPRAGAGRGGGSTNPHPTLKPIALTRWLARLIMPPTPGARLLVPYSGVGSEMIGALLAGWPHVYGIEGDFDGAGYVEIAHARIAHWLKGGGLGQ